MGVSVVVRTEDGEHLLGLSDAAASVPPPSPSLVWTWLVPEGREVEFPLLRGIDAYGDTCFNRMQRPLLLAELDALEASGLEGADLSFIRALRIMIVFAEASPHRYLWFVGD